MPVSEPVSDWLRLLDDPEEARGLFGAAPDLSARDLFYTHVDERGPSVTLGFQQRGLPGHPRPEWEEQGCNAFEFYLVFTGVTDLRIEGLTTAPKNVRLTGGGSSGTTVEITAPGDRMSFRAETVSFCRPRAFLMSASE